MNYKESLNLPQTDFPMKANLSQKEPAILALWEEARLYEKIRETAQGRDLYILHDGPPYANGSIHLGTALNKILKDIVIKAKNMSGFDSVYVPGWDCHGLPIEHQVDKELGEKSRSISQTEKRRLCRTYAEKYVGIQRDQFRRLGVLGDWWNPYLTMNYDYEAVTVAEFGKLYLNGSVYKGKKPVYWCASCKTALAEAEIEYADHRTPSIYVKFPFLSDPAVLSPKLKGKKVSFVIWTTTPWTLLANLAIALSKDFVYAAVQVGGEVLVVAKEMVEKCLDAFGFKSGDFEIVDEFPGSRAERLTCRHPLVERESLLINAPFVNLESGTGCVHIAPGHGQEDYEIGMEYGLENYAPVDDDGKFTADVKDFAGQFVFAANQNIIGKLKESGFLLGSLDFVHSYPHCWRCKNPIIFRSTEQWFISMDKNDLRKKALAAIDKVSWIPAWGRERIYGMVENRPDWCISRQRSWGVPIAMFTCGTCGREVMTEEIMRHLVELVRQFGADVWFEREPKDLLPAGTVCPDCGGDAFAKETDILDVWFDSGVSHAAVLERRSGHRTPADMYLEGNDQHRGWFHSSLLESIGTRGVAPYRNVLTHGFVVDGEGKKMSKSVGNVIDSQEIIDQYGAEILRLWVAAADYTDDIRISEEILKRLVEAYRRIRNTSRYILGNLYDFDCTANMVPYGDLEEMDRWILHRLQEVIQRVREAYGKYQFHVVYTTLYNFCTVDLSAFYLDVLKDRLYTSGAASKERRSAQSAIFLILDAMVRLMAPIMSFTAEEVWNSLPAWAGKEASVHLARFPAANPEQVDQVLDENWKNMIAVRGEVSKVIEAARKNKVLGHSMDASVDIAPPEALRGLLEAHREALRAILIVSEVNIVSGDQIREPYQSTEMDGLVIGVMKAPGKKCNRCWIYSESVGTDAEHPLICSRCLTTIRN